MATASARVNGSNGTDTNAGTRAFAAAAPVAGGGDTATFTAGAGGGLFGAWHATNVPKTSRRDTKGEVIQTGRSGVRHSMGSIISVFPVSLKAGPTQASCNNIECGFGAGGPSDAGLRNGCEIHLDCVRFNKQQLEECALPKHRIDPANDEIRNQDQQHNEATGNRLT